MQVQRAASKLWPQPLTKGDHLAELGSSVRAVAGHVTCNLHLSASLLITCHYFIVIDNLNSVATFKQKNIVINT